MLSAYTRLNESIKNIAAIIVDMVYVNESCTKFLKEYCAIRLREYVNWNLDLRNPEALCGFFDGIHFNPEHRVLTVGYTLALKDTLFGTHLSPVDAKILSLLNTKDGFMSTTGSASQKIIETHNHLHLGNDIVPKHAHIPFRDQLSLELVIAQIQSMIGELTERNNKLPSCYLQNPLYAGFPESLAVFYENRQKFMSCDFSLTKEDAFVAYLNRMGAEAQFSQRKAMIEKVAGILEDSLAAFLIAFFSKILQNFFHMFCPRFKDGSFISLATQSAIFYGLGLLITAKFFINVEIPDDFTVCMGVLLARLIAVFSEKSKQLFNSLGFLSTKQFIAVLIGCLALAFYILPIYIMVSFISPIAAACVGEYLANLVFYLQKTKQALQLGQPNLLPEPPPQGDSSQRGKRSNRGGKRR